MKKKKGFLLVMVMFILLFLVIIVPVMVQWVKDDTKISVKDQKASFAFQLAEAAVDRGYWKVKSSTTTFNQVSEGGSIAGYNFDTTYHDIANGTYRVKVIGGPGSEQVTIIGEGRDLLRSETRAIQTVFSNVSVPGAIIAGGLLSATGASVVHWGPIMAMGDINVSGTAASNGFPRKLSRQTVRPFDPTGDTNPPNTDNLEWWSNYNVPELPKFDFTSLRASAAATSTLNCNDVAVSSETYSTAYNPCAGSGCTDPGSNCSCTPNTCQGTACTGAGSPCSCTKGCYGGSCVDPGSNCSCTGSGASRLCLGSGCSDSDGAGSNCACDSNYSCTGAGCADSDGAGSACACSKTCTGSGCADSDGAGSNCNCTVTVTTTPTTITGMNCCYSTVFGGPVTCSYGGSGCTNCSVNNINNYASLIHKDYTWYWDNNVDWAGRNGLKGTIIVRGNLGINGGDYYSSLSPLTVPPAAWQEYQKMDTSAINQYPGDLGLHTSSGSYAMGSCSMSCEGGPLGADLGVWGFLYVGGNFNRAGDSDVYGAMWVVGNVSGAGNTMLFYNSNLNVATLNVVLVKNSWQEVTPDTQVWPD
jgi:hypothetical protein